jgi:MFS family permease
MSTRQSAGHRNEQITPRNDPVTREAPAGTNSVTSGAAALIAGASQLLLGVLKCRRVDLFRHREADTDRYGGAALASLESAPAAAATASSGQHRWGDMTDTNTRIGGNRHLAGHRREQIDSTWRFAVAGLCASLVGIGLARFAYTPLIPALISAKWFSASDVIYLGAANLAGYLAGALLARPIAARFGATRSLRGMMVLATLTCFASSAPVSFLWFFGWRFLAGLSGGVIMVLAASVVLPHTSPARRGIVGGVIFAGVGLGIAASGTLVPLLLQLGLRESWYGLGALSALLTLISWTNWPKEDSASKTAPAAHRAPHSRQSHAVRALLIEYGLNACALVPHMVFVVDFVARGLGQGILVASHYWVFYGLGAIVGPLVTGILPTAGFDRRCACPSWPRRSSAPPAISTSPASLIVSSVVIGAHARHRAAGAHAFMNCCRTAPTRAPPGAMPLRALRCSGRRLRASRSGCSRVRRCCRPRRRRHAFRARDDLAWR